MLKQVSVSENMLIVIIGDFYSRCSTEIRSLQDYELNVAMATVIKATYDKEEDLKEKYNIANDIEYDLPAYIIGLFKETGYDVKNEETAKDWLYSTVRNIIPTSNNIEDTPYPMHIEDINIAIAEPTVGGYFEVVADSEKDIKNSINVLINWGLSL